jgi:hypothetical protein
VVNEKPRAREKVNGRKGGGGGGGGEPYISKRLGRRPISVGMVPAKVLDSRVLSGKERARKKERERGEGGGGRGGGQCPI